ncbi:DUF1801 domain-containing protein [Microbacterium sp. P02]|uniref:DUF1801 domain-containing protein n=1 Tax=unclassified Microbacterium TaxID=2609290 RepID=UPI00366F14C7
MTAGEDDVDRWFDDQTHDLVETARSLREAILRAAPEATESIKWKAPNFALADDFATFSLRRPGQVQVILHTGAKPKPGSPQISVDDLGGRLRWADRNRAVVTFTSATDAAAALPAFETLVRDWVAQL